MLSRFLPLLLCLLSLCGFSVAPLAAQEAVSAAAQEAVNAIEIKTVAGLRFDPIRFVVKPGEKCKLTVENTDDMAHNFVLVAPGARGEVVAAAAAIPITPEETFIPKSDNILQHTTVLTPGKSVTLEFTAPETEGVYPYVCTYPGHGVIMFGAMYVTTKGEAILPSVPNDENLPDIIREQAKTPTLHAFPAEPPNWYRIFMRESGPASFAVSLPTGQNYCWDAGACRLRYVWRGAFVDPMPQWTGKGDGFAEIKGTIYYRPASFPIRIGDVKKVPSEVRFRGFDVVDRYPEFRYTLDGGVEVRELIKAAHHGGLEVTYKVSGTRSQVFYVVEPGSGVEATSAAGKFSEGVLKLAADKAKQFTVNLLEITNKEPIGYWSMNDTLAEKIPLVTESVKGRAVTFDGKKTQYATGIKTLAVADGGTFMAWARLSAPPAAQQVCIGAKKDDEEFALGANLAGVPGYGVLVKNGEQESKITAVMPMEADDKWHWLAATFDPKKGLRFYLDGKPAGLAAPTPFPEGAEFFLGSAGNADFAGATMDEVRIYGRVLDAKEIAALYETERLSLAAKLPPPTPAPKNTPKPSGKSGAGAATPAPQPAATPAAKGPKKPVK